MTPDPLLQSKHSVTKTTQRPVNATMDLEVLTFFDDETTELSGSERRTRVLPKSLTHLSRELYAKYPSLVRSQTERNGGINAVLSEVSDTDVLTVDQANSLAAERAKAQPGWSHAKEYAVRRLAWDVNYASELHANRERRKACSHGTEPPAATENSSNIHTVSETYGPHFVGAQQQTATRENFQHTERENSQHTEWEIKPMYGTTYNSIQYANTY